MGWEWRHSSPTYSGEWVERDMDPPRIKMISPFFSMLRDFFSYEISSLIEGGTLLPQYEIGCSYSQNSNWANCLMLTWGSERDSKWMEILHLMAATLKIMKFMYRWQNIKKYFQQESCRHWQSYNLLKKLWVIV